MTTRVSVVLSGIGGYGGQYLDLLLDPASQDRVELVGAVDPFPEQCARLAELRARGVPVFPSLQAFYAQASAELAIISAPIHEHCPQTCLALEHGSHVLCEKPLAATVQDADRMIEARDRAGLQAAIGYQWSFCPAILNLKRDILAGCFGQARRLTTVVLWPRTQDYYRRNAWAGRQKSVDGAWVLDSPVNNAAAHYLHNMLFVLGEAVDRSAGLDRAQAELYRANPIENYDTAALRCFTDGGAEVLFYTSHAVSENVGPQFVFEFERGVVRLDGLDGVISATLEDGGRIDYGAPDHGERHKLWAAVDAVANGAHVPCGIEAARSQTACMNGAQESMAHIAAFDPRLLRRRDTSEGTLTFVEGLGQALLNCAERHVLPSEAGLEWARAGREVGLRGYRRFPSQ